MQYVDEMKKRYSDLRRIKVKYDLPYVELDIDIEDMDRFRVVSSLCNTMGKKLVEEFTEQEKKIYEDLCQKGEVSAKELERIGNVDSLEEILEDIIDEKAKSFIPTAMEELKSILIRSSKIAEHRILQLNRYDREQILEQKKSFLTKINGINADSEEVFGDWCVKIESNKAQAICELRGYYRDYLQLSEKEGVKTHFETRSVSTARWFLPWTWGNSMREVYSYDERYKYIDASDAMENIRNFANDASACIEDTFHKSYNIAYTKRKILNTIIEHFDVTDENYTPTYYKMLVDRILNQITLPVLNIDGSKYMNVLATQFYGEIRDNATRTDLKRILSSAVGDLFAEICHTFEEKIQIYKEEVEKIKREFSKELLEDMNKELNLVLEQYEDKENEIKRYYELVDILKKIEEELNYA